MIILIASQKGGCGKSTLATNIAVALSKEGKDVLLVDADKQASASKWAKERSVTHTDNKHIPWVEDKYDDIRASLIDLGKMYEIVIVDTAGRDSIEMRSAMLVADKMLVPTRPTQFDLDTIPHINKIVHVAKEVNPELEVFVVITMSPGNSKGDTVEATEYLTDFKNLKLCNTTIGDRKIYKESNFAGLGVTELPAKTTSDKAGQSELIQLVAELSI